MSDHKHSPPDALKRYLANHAEAIARPDFVANSAQDLANTARIKACQSGRYRWVLVVPAFDEPPNFQTQLIQNLDFGKLAKGCLLIRVVNAPSDATPIQRQRTLAALPDATAHSPENIGNGVHMLTINAVSEPLPADQATGLARKLGNDIACLLISAGHIAMPLLCNTDADAILPADYFSRLGRALAAHSNRQSAAAWILPFTHEGATPTLHDAGTAYELYLRSLHLNLARCGSPYAYPALGSVLAINPDLYAKSRGFPKRRAGEDFYLLNKLAKMADVVYLTGTPVRLAARASARVPFGTGPAITRLLEAPIADNPIAACQTYALNSFVLLRQFYAGMTDLHSQPSADSKPATARALPHAWRDPDLGWLLKRLGLPAALIRLQKNHRTDKALQRALHEWFDALKVVRFLNEARHFHPDETLLDQLEHLSGFVTQTAEQAAANKLSSALTRASAINLSLERIRVETRHCVAHTPQKGPAE